MSWAETTHIEVDDVRVDSCDVGLPLTIQHGRYNPNSQPDAPTCTFTYLGDTPPQLGQLVRVISAYPSQDPATWLDDRFTWNDMSVSWLGSTGDSVRFMGEVSRVTAVEDSGEIVSWAITATGHMAQLGDRAVLMERPQETDVARVTAILTATGFPFIIYGTDTKELAADAIDKDALGALHEICGWTGGMLWQRRDGTIVYGTTAHRDTEAVAVLPCEILADGIAWELDTDQIVNKLVLHWETPAGSTQQTYNDAGSQLRWGVQDANVTTKLWEGQEDVVAAIILFRRSEPKWTLPGTIYSDWTRNTNVQERAMLSVDVSDTVLLPIAPTPGPTPAPNSQWTLEGWVEIIDATGRYSQLSITDHTRYSTASLRTWQQALDLGTWQDWIDLGTWRELLVKAGTL